MLRAAFRRPALLVLVTLAAVLVVALGARGRPSLRCDADRLRHTLVTPHLEAPLGQGTNVLYRDAQMPYFALWVDNPELLVRR